MKCATPNCENHNNQGKFVGSFCSPCHDFYMGKESIHSQAHRNYVEKVSSSPLVTTLRSRINKVKYYLEVRENGNRDKALYIVDHLYNNVLDSQSATPDLRKFL